MTDKTLKHFFEVYKPKAPDEQKFVDKHVTIKHKDRNGNDDDVFKATNIKTIGRKEERHGYDSGEDEKVYEEVEDLDELSRDTLRRYRMKSKAIGDNEKGDINYRSKGRDLAARKTHGGQWGIPKAKVMAKEEVEQLEEGTMKLSKVHIVHHHDHPAAKEFAKHYTEGMKGMHREGGPSEKDEAASNKFHERYSGMTTRHGFAGSGTTIYHDHKTGAKWKVDRHPNGKTFYGTDHIISHHIPSVNESVEEEILSTEAEDRVIRSLVAYYEELGEEVLIDDIVAIAEEMLDELSVKTLDSYRTKARKELIDADANDDNHLYNKRAKGYRAASKSVNKKLKEEAEDLEELSTATLQSYRKKARAQGNAIVDKMKLGGGDWSKDQKDTKTLRKRAAGAQASGKQLVKRGESLKTEEAEQIDELSKNTLRSYVDKRATQRDLTSHDIVRKNIAAASGVKPRNKPESAASTRSYHRAINKIVKDKDSPDRPKVLATEEAEQIDELSKATLGSYIKKAKTQMSRSDTVAGRLAGERMKGGKPSAQERKHSDRANKRYFGIDKAVDKLTKEEVEQIDELSAKTLGSYVSKAARSAGSNIAGAVASGMANGNKDDQRSMGRNYAKRLKGIDTAAKKLTKEDVINRAVEKYSPSEEERLSLDEQLVARIEDMQESHIHLILNLFEQLDESNQRNLLDMIDQGRVNEVLDFAISAVRGE